MLLEIQTDHVFPKNCWSIFFVRNKLFVSNETFLRTNIIYSTAYRRSHQRCSRKKSALKNITKFTGKHLCIRPATLLKKRLWHMFSCEFCEIFKNTFFAEHLGPKGNHRRCSVKKSVIKNFVNFTGKHCWMPSFFFQKIKQKKPLTNQSFFWTLILLKINIWHLF